jgi:hypothetical protein
MHNTDPIKKPGFHYAQSLVFCVVYCGQLSFWTSVQQYPEIDKQTDNLKFINYMNCRKAVN